MLWGLAIVWSSQISALVSWFAYCDVIPTDAPQGLVLGVAIVWSINALAWSAIGAAGIAEFDADSQENQS